MNSLKGMIEATIVAAALSLLVAPAALAQPWPGNPIQQGPPPGSPVTTLRTPLLVGAPWEPAYVPPPPGQPPPIGDGPVPYPVTPGMAGGPNPPPASQVYIGQIQPGYYGKQQATADLAGALTPPTNFTPTDPGSLPGPMDFTPPPAAIVNINPDGGMPGDQAPQTRWGAQTTRDFGNVGNLVYGPGSQLTDFGELLPNKPNIKVQPQFSQDGPRNMVVPGQMDQINRSPNRPNAQETEDLNGNRSLFKGPNLQSVQTIAPY